MTPIATTKNPPWRDLCRSSFYHTLLEIIRPISLCVGATWAAVEGGIGLSLLLLLFGHIAALRSAHGAVHHTLGLPRTGDKLVLYTVSALLVTSCHALDLTHKHHHRRCGQEDDVEGRIANLGFWQACLVSPTYHGQVILAAWRLGKTHRRLSIILDLGLAALLHGLLFYYFGTAVYWLWLGLAALNASSGLLSVWLFHRGGEATRSGHWAIVNWLAMGMLYHGEHHRYPGVPTARLGELAKRMKVAKTAPPPLFGTDG